MVLVVFFVLYGGLEFWVWLFIGVLVVYLIYERFIGEDIWLSNKVIGVVGCFRRSYSFIDRVLMCRFDC